jgi:hypothetical protein
MSWKSLLESKGVHRHRATRKEINALRQLVARDRMVEDWIDRNHPEFKAQ